MAAERVVEVRRLGQTEYSEAESLMTDLQQQRLQDDIVDTLLFCSHPEVVTIGPEARRDKVVVQSEYPTTAVSYTHLTLQTIYSV